MRLVSDALPAFSTAESRATDGTDDGSADRAIAERSDAGGPDVETPAVEESLDLAGIWARSLDSLAEGMLPPQQRAWMRLTRPIALVEDTAVLAAPNEFAKEVLDTRLRPLIVEALSAELGRDVRVAVTVDPQQAHDDAGTFLGGDDSSYVADELEELDETDGTEISW